MKSKDKEITIYFISHYLPRRTHPPCLSVKGPHLSLGCPTYMTQVPLRLGAHSDYFQTTILVVETK